MYKAFSLALLAGGVVLAIIAIGASKSLGSDISRFFTGSPTDNAKWMMVGAGVLFLIGLGGLLRGSRATT